MKKGRTDIIFVVDRSGSMFGIANDMIGGFNKFIEDQRKVPGECLVSFYQFDDVYEVVFERKRIQDVELLNSNTYVPRGMTALHDSIGKTINSYGQYLSNLPEEERPEKVLFIIITDGKNNSSVEFSLQKVGEMVKHQTEKYSWNFVYMGSNIDAWDEGNLLNINPHSTLQYTNVGGSVSSSYASLSRCVTNYRVDPACASFSFTTDDLKEQQQYLDGDLKEKNKQQIDNLNNSK